MAEAALVWLSMEGLFGKETFELGDPSNKEEPTVLGRLFQVEEIANAKTLR